MKILDRYILRQFVATLAFSMLALYVIFLVVSLIENLDDFMDQGVDAGVIVKYYLYFFPEILKLLTPVGMLLSTLFTVGRLSNLNEITAMKSGGQSLYRLMLPLMIFAVLLSVGNLYFNGWVVPEANKSKIEIEQIYLKKVVAGNQLYNLYFRESPSVNLTLQSYDSERRSGRRITIDEFTAGNSPRLKKRVEAEQMQWDSGKKHWKLKDGIIRDFTRQDRPLMSRFREKAYDLNITHSKLMALKKTTDEMDFDELWNHIQTQKMSGRNVKRELIDYYAEIAYPFANLIVILFAVPFASVKKRGGVAVQIGSALVISFFYLIFTRVSLTIGYSSDIPPLLAGWLANGIFFVIGIINILRTKS